MGLIETEKRSNWLDPERFAAVTHFRCWHLTVWAPKSPSSQGNPASGELLRPTAFDCPVRSKSICCCSRIPSHGQSGSTSRSRPAPTAVEVAAAAPTTAGVPRARCPSDLPGQQHAASRGSDSNPSRRCRPSLDPIDHRDTSDSSARAPPARYRQPVRKRTAQSRHLRAHS
jgi:hypothetical protein